MVPSSKLKCVSPPCLSSPLRIERSPSPTKVEDEEKIKSSRDQVKKIQEATKYWVTFWIHIKKLPDAKLFKMYSFELWETCGEDTYMIIVIVQIPANIINTSLHLLCSLQVE